MQTLASRIVRVNPAKLYAMRLLPMRRHALRSPFIYRITSFRDVLAFASGFSFASHSA
ncbi:protein of unknown function [Paraburkholderia kururiensis]